LWTVLEILKRARRMAAPGCTTYIGSQISLEEMKASVLHADAGVRLIAVELICGNPKSTEMPSDDEFALLRLFLRTSLKDASPENRQIFGLSLKKIMTTVHDSLRVASRAASHNVVSSDTGANKKGTSKKKKKNGGDASSLEPATTTAAVAPTSTASTEDVAKNTSGLTFCRWTVAHLLSQLYPGAPFARMVMCLEVLLAVVQPWVADAQGALKHKKTEGTSSSILQATASSIMEDLSGHHAISVLQNLLLNSWDQVRSLSSQILNIVMCFAAARDVSGDDSGRHRHHQKFGGSGSTPLQRREDLGQMCSWSLELTTSPRRRESDAGALLLQLVFEHYVQRHRLSLDLQPPAHIDSIVDAQSNTQAAALVATYPHLLTPRTRALSTVEPALYFIVQLVSILRHRVDVQRRHVVQETRCADTGLADAAAATTTTPSPAPVHGLILALRYIHEKLQYPKAGDHPSGQPEDTKDTRLRLWRDVMATVLTEVEDAFELALSVVGGDSVAQSGAAQVLGTGGGDSGTTAGNGAQQNAIPAPSFAVTSNQTTQAAIGLNAVGNVVTDGYGGGSGGMDDDDMDGGGKDGADGGGGEGASAFQKVVVGSWLCVKECCNFLAMLVETLPLPQEPRRPPSQQPGAGAVAAPQAGNGNGNENGGGSWLLTTGQISRIGDRLLHSMFVLKHAGATFAAHQALQVVCGCMLRAGDRNPTLCRIPLQVLEYRC
jgi:hypothetical protein